MAGRQSYRTRVLLQALLAMTASAALVAVTPASVEAQVLSSKRGFADAGANYSNLQATGAGWYYTWGLGEGYPGSFDAQFAPMFWGGWAVNSGNINAVKNNADVEWVLGFNEPERSDQANMTVSQAISSWTTLSNGFAGSGKKLVSPAVSDTSDGKAWMSDFMTQANNNGLQVDAVAFHWYGWSSPSNPSQAASNFIGSMNWYHQWGLPVFVTEFAIHDWGGAYTDEEVSEANRQFLDIVIPWMESTSWVQGYAWYHWFGDAHLYEGNPATPTQMGYEYIGVIESGESYDFSGVDHGEHVAFLAGGELSHNSSGGTLKYINALEGANIMSGSTDYSVSGGWVRVQDGATLRKTGASTVTMNSTSIENDGVFEVAEGTVRMENYMNFSGSGKMRVKSGGTVSFHGVRDIISMDIDTDVELAGGTLDATALSEGIRLDSGAKLSGSGTVTGKLTAKTGTTIQIGSAGLQTSAPMLIDDFDSYDNSSTTALGATPGNLTGDVWVGEWDGTGGALITDDPDGDQSLAVREGSGWRGAETDLVSNFANDYSLADGETATYFFQVMAEGTATDCMIGLAESRASVDINNSWQDFSVMPYIAGGNLKVYSDNLGDQTVTSMTNGDWYNVWVVVDNAAKTFDMYYSTGTDAGTLAYSGLEFGRITDPVDLGAFAAMNNGTDLVHVDNLYMISGESTANPLVGGGAFTYSPDVLTVDGELVLESGTTVVFDIATDGINDLLEVTGNLTAAGTLEVVLDGSAPALTAGDSFDLLDFATISGAFDTLTLPTLDAGLMWDTSALLTTGVLEVVSSLLDGDLNGDGFVGLDDLDIVLGNWNTNVTAGEWSLGDPSGDGFVGLDDLDIVLNNWNAGTPPTDNANIPEPASVVLLGLGGMAMLRRRR